MVKISIIVPVYNVEKYFKNCIESILNQTFKDFELILVNDGSTDSSGDICNEYAKKDDRIKVIHQGNKGQASARNRGLDIARGKYIGFVDSDDTIHPRMYEILYKSIKDSYSKIVISNYKDVYNQDNLEYDDIKDIKMDEINNIDIINRLYDSEVWTLLVVPWNKLYSREIFDGVRYPEGRIIEDEAIIHELLYKSKKLLYIDIKLYNYLHREGSTTSNKSLKKKIDWILALSDRMKFLNKVGLDNIYNKTTIIYINTFFKTYNSLIESNDYDKLLLNKLRNDFISNIKLLMKLKSQTTKSKLLWLVLCINPSIYNVYYKQKHVI